MAAAVADVARVDSLTEQFGRQRLENSSAHRSENLASQLSVDDDGADVQLAPHSGAWIICERTHTKNKHARRANHWGKVCQCAVGRNLQDLHIKESPHLVSEVRVIKIVGDKRNSKRIETVKLPRGEEGYAHDKQEPNTEDGKRNEALDLSSSSDDELRELFTSKVKSPEQYTAIHGKEDGADNYLVRQSGLAQGLSDKSDCRRKRYKIGRGSLKKKIKISRPYLDLEKMEERRLEDLEAGGKNPENIFHPIYRI